jgi:hypothetical protein
MAVNSEAIKAKTEATPLCTHKVIERKYEVAEWPV